MPRKQGNIPIVHFLLEPDGQTRSWLLPVLAELALTPPAGYEPAPERVDTPEDYECEDD